MVIVAFALTKYFSGAFVVSMETLVDTGKPMHYNGKIKQQGSL